MGVSAAYALYRMTQRASVAVEDTSSYAPISPEQFARSRGYGAGIRY